MVENSYAAVYARVSSEEQGRGFSLPTQVEACLEMAKREGYVVPEGYIFTEEISGTILERSELRKVRELVNTKAISAVIVHDPDRLARNLLSQLLLDEEAAKVSVKLLFVMHQREGSAEGNLFFQMRGSLAEYERAKLMERTRRGLIGRIKAGHPHGGQVPLGYRYISEPHGGRWEIDDEEAAVVKRIFELCLKGESTRGIAKLLTDEHILTKWDRGPRAVTRSWGRENGVGRRYTES